MSLIALLVVCQVIGTLVGAFTAVWSEIAYVRAMKDGTVDAAEREHLRVIASGLRFGMLIILLSSFGIVVTAYKLQAGPQPALTPNYWISIVLALVIIGVSWALSRQRVSFAIGSAVVFAAWWFLAYLMIGWLPPLSFGAAILFFVVVAAIFYALFTYVHLFALRKG